MIDVSKAEKEFVRVVKPKRISVSSKRQITIPKEYFDQLNIVDEVICQVVDGELIIKPVEENVDFSQFILRELINEGYSAGEELLEEFVRRKTRMNPALQQMIAEERDYKVYSSTEDFFDELNDTDD